MSGFNHDNAIEADKAVLFSTGMVTPYRSGVMFYDNLRSALIYIDMDHTVQILHVFASIIGGINGLFINKGNISLFKEKGSIFELNMDTCDEKTIVDIEAGFFLKHVSFGNVVYSIPEYILIKEDCVHLRCYQLNNNIILEKKFIINCDFKETTYHVVRVTQSGFVLFAMDESKDLLLIINFENFTIQVVDRYCENMQIQAFYEDAKNNIVAILNKGADILCHFGGKEQIISGPEKMDEAYSSIVFVSDKIYVLPRFGRFVACIDANQSISFHEMETDMLLSANSVGKSKYLECLEMGDETWFFPYAEGVIYTINNIKKLQPVRLKGNLDELALLYYEKNIFKTQIVKEESGLLKHFIRYMWLRR